MEGPFYVENNFLSDKERLEVYRGIYRLKEFWVQNTPEVAWWTIGAAAYLDALKGQKTYEDRAKLINPILWKEFEWLYEKYRQILGQTLSAPISFNRNYALPGFHIFQYRSDLDHSCKAVAHYDRQYQLLKWEEPVGGHVSATVCITLPAEGGGLNYWDDSVDLITVKKKYQPYNEGGMTLHFGDVWHQIANAKNPSHKDERITFQGQAVFLEDSGTWEIYR